MYPAATEVKVEGELPGSKIANYTVCIEQRVMYILTLEKNYAADAWLLRYCNARQLQKLLKSSEPGR